MEQITTFKIRIDSISELKIGFELFSGDKVHDTYVNVLHNGSYGVNNRFSLTPKQFGDFARRLIAYTYTTKQNFNDDELKILWNLNITIFDHEAQQLSKSIFLDKYRRNKLVELGLLKLD